MCPPGGGVLAMFFRMGACSLISECDLTCSMDCGLPIRRIAGWILMRRSAFSASAICLTVGRAHRSEEHTSELQSLMRISYAVFCLKKKKLNKHMKFHQAR